MARAEWPRYFVCTDAVGPVRQGTLSALLCVVAAMCAMRVRAVVTLNRTLGICRSVGQCRAAAGFHDAVSSAMFDDATQAYAAPTVVRGRLPRVRVHSTFHIVCVFVDSWMGPMGPGWVCCLL